MVKSLNWLELRSIPMLTHKTGLARQQLESDLRRAVQNGELSLHYQPIVGLHWHGVTSCEALMRWTSESRGSVSPAEFIPVAEDIGLIGQMGEWAIWQACKDAARWPDKIKVAVNLSADQFAGSELLMAARHALEKSGLEPSRLSFEVTETLMLQDSAATLKTLTELRQMGIEIALDDFGTGYASLNYLRSFPFDKLKIDQVFVRDLKHRIECDAIVRAVVDLARSLGMRSVAEGVETLDHLRQVSIAGCDEVQGYFFSRPVEAGNVLDAITQCDMKLQLAA